MILVRVELRAPDPEGRAYQRLKVGLNEAGFAQTLQRADGTRFKLPQGEFRAQEDAVPTLEAAREAAALVARSVDPEAAVLVTQVGEWLAAGLKVKL